MRWLHPAWLVHLESQVYPPAVSGDPASFDFQEPKKLRVLVCDKVAAGAPILFVAHDEDGDWQFLCGAQHDEETRDMGQAWSLAGVVARDPSVNELAQMERSWTAHRKRPGAGWDLREDMEEEVRENVREHGCHVMLVAREDEGADFGYSIGLYKNFEQPELICIGLSPEVTHQLLNEMLTLIEQGEVFHEGDELDLLEGYVCVLKEVHPSRYAEYFGYATGFYGGDEFPAFQVVWPDKKHRYPGDEGCWISEDAQPRLWLKEA